ncbi:hypothetical protein RDI58_014580 [Solanum bulbocastanum]|uniref:Uncharacterized protein n=1 Tax=Solanum bulbocastanum TaxID=147425 RepID=A0AAN8YAP7_SOLBU
MSELTYAYHSKRTEEDSHWRASKHGNENTTKTGEIQSVGVKSAEQWSELKGSKTPVLTNTTPDSNMTKSEERRIHEDREIQSSNYLRQQEGFDGVVSREGRKGRRDRTKKVGEPVSGESYGCASGLGIPLFADECTKQVDRVSYVRVLIEMDISQNLPTDIKVEDPNGREFNQKVVYECVPAYCPKCLIIGHKCSAKGEEHKQKLAKGRQNGNKRGVNNKENPARHMRTVGNKNEDNYKPRRMWRNGRKQKGQRQHMGMAKISIANGFGPLHDHDTRCVADMDKVFRGAVKVTGKDEILGFYKSFLGTCAPQLPIVDGQAMKDGPRLDTSKHN